GADPTARTSPAGVRTDADRAPAKRRGSRALSIAVVTVLVAAAAVVGAVVIPSLSDRDTAYPPVPGPLGASLEELQKSVEDAP
ncbi:serine/threonine protein kinase, partial [Clavibacter lycopersici]